MNARRLAGAIGRTTGRAALALVAALALLQGWYLARVIHYAGHDPATTAFIELRRGQGQTIRRQWVAYDDISPWLRRAVVAAEDARFVDHPGFDWSALRAALADNIAAERIVRGGSTISQQLAKNLFLSPRQSLLRKLQEAVITVMIEQAMTKRRILELYLNVIEWGQGVFGAEAAARHYYARPAARIDRWRAALLAARIPRPGYYDRIGTTPYLIERASDIYAWAGRVRIP